MTFRGNTRQTAAFWAAVAFFVIAVLFPIESGSASGDVGQLKLPAGFAAAMGVISTIGVWTMGLSKATDN